MITDTWFKFKEWCRQLFCHHEYVANRKLFTNDFYYICRKCNRRVNETPKELQVHDGK